jgi:hypothetical protein
VVGSFVQIPTVGYIRHPWNRDEIPRSCMVSAI